MLLTVSIQSDPIVISICEICIFILNLDPISNPRSEILNRLPVSHDNKYGIASKISKVQFSSHPAQSAFVTSIAMSQYSYLGKMHSIATNMSRKIYKTYPQHRSVVIQDAVSILFQVCYIIIYLKEFLFFSILSNRFNFYRGRPKRI
jgi:predicted AlkP superfamily pyrophosphatase or phosphodiesterase